MNSRSSIFLETGFSFTLLTGPSFPLFSGLQEEASGLILVGMAPQEKVVWKGKSSQITNFWPFLTCLLLIAVIIYAWYATGVTWMAFLAFFPLGFAFWTWLQLRCTVFELTNERIRVYEGVLNQEINEVELYRVKDTRIRRPFWLRLFGLSNLVLTTSDRSLPQITLPAISQATSVREKLRRYVELLRDRKRVREVDFEDGDGDLDLL